MEQTLQNIIFNYRAWIQSCDPQLLNSQLTDCLKKSTFTILQQCDQYFEPEGYTAIWILAESHLALHTFPEHQASYIELSSCNNEKQELFIQLLNNYFTTKPA